MKFFITLILILSARFSFGQCEELAKLKDQMGFDQFVRKEVSELKYSTQDKACISDSDFNFLLSDEVKAKGWVLPDFVGLAELASFSKSTIMVEAYLAYYKKNFKSSASESLRNGFATLFREKTPTVMNWLAAQSKTDQQLLVSDSCIGFLNVYGSSVLRKNTIRRIVGTNWEAAKNSYKHSKLILELSKGIDKCEKVAL